MGKGTLIGAVVLALASGCGGGGGGPRATGQLQVMTRCQVPSATATTSELVDLKVLNASNQTVAFADITLRYYLSYELTNGAMPAAELDYVQNFQLSQLTRTFSTGYFELGFTQSTGDLAASDSTGGSGEIIARLHASDYSQWNSSRDDDYSFTPCDDPTVPPFLPRPTVTAYVGNTLAWGVEP